MTPTARAMRAAGAILCEARRVAVVTGAGISAESGIPTFRGPDGTWDKVDPMWFASPEGFAAQPAEVTAWYDQRRQQALACQPNAAHRALVELDARLRGNGGGVTILTQNVDRLHQRAGSRDVVELHGSLHVWRCTRTGEEREDLPCPLPEHPCPSPAGGLWRPGVVWFGEMLPEAALAAAYDVLDKCDVVMSIGTSAVVYPAASFVELAMGRGAVGIEINIDPTPISRLVHHRLPGPAAEVLPELARLASGPA